MKSALKIKCIIIKPHQTIQKSITQLAMGDTFYKIKVTTSPDTERKLDRKSSFLDFQI